MKKNNWEKKIEERLTDLLNEAGFSIKSSREQAIPQIAEKADTGIDILLQAESLDGKEFELAVEVKSSGEPRMARMAIQQLREYPKNRPGVYRVFGAPYITEETGKLCKREGFGYVDAAGNCSLSFGSTFIQVKGNPNPFKNGKKLKFLFSPKSSRVLRVLLNNPGKSWFVRDIAEEADVSLGQASNVKKRLLDYELIKEEKKAFKLTQPTKLLQRWSENYSYAKSPARNFYSLLPLRELEKEIAWYCAETSTTYAFTLFSGAARAAPYTRYSRCFVYAIDFPQDACKKLQLKEVSTGANLTILDPYDDGVLYALQDVNNEKVVCDIQLYLDLKSFGGRGEEAAGLLLEKRIIPRWQQSTITIR